MKKVFLYFKKQSHAAMKTLMPGGKKSSYIIKQTYSEKLQLSLGIYYHQIKIK